MNAGHFERGDHVDTPDGKGVVLMPCTPGWDRCTVLVAPGNCLPYQRDYYENQLKERP